MLYFKTFAVTPKSSVSAAPPLAAVEVVVVVVVVVRWQSGCLRRVLGEIGRVVGEVQQHMASKGGFLGKSNIHDSDPGSNTNSHALHVRTPTVVRNAQLYLIDPLQLEVGLVRRLVAERRKACLCMCGWFVVCTAARCLPCNKHG